MMKKKKKDLTVAAVHCAICQEIVVWKGGFFLSL